MINYQFNIKWSRKLGQMGPVGSTRLIRGDIRKCTMLIGYCPKKAFSSIHYFLSANLYKRQERKVPVVMAHRNSRMRVYIFIVFILGPQHRHNTFFDIYMRLRWTSQAKDVSALMDMVSCLIKSVDTVIKRQNDLQETLNDKEAGCTTLRDENRRSSEAWLHIWLLPTSRPLIVDICWLLSSSHLPVVDICWWLSV